MKPIRPATLAALRALDFRHLKNRPELYAIALGVFRVALQLAAIIDGPRLTEVINLLRRAKDIGVQSVIFANSGEGDREAVDAMLAAVDAFEAGAADDAVALAVAFEAARAVDGKAAIAAADVPVTPLHSDDRLTALRAAAAAARGKGGDAIAAAIAVRDASVRPRTNRAEIRDALTTAGFGDRAINAAIQQVMKGVK
jgi:hypothetical protein